MFTLIIMLLFSVVNVFNNSRMVIGVMAEDESSLDKLKQDTILNINSMGTKEVKGGDVIAAIRYYKDENIKVIVEVGSVIKTYENTLYKASDFSISELEFYESNFSYSISNDQKIINFTRQ